MLNQKTGLISSCCLVDGQKSALDPIATPGRPNCRVLAWAALKAARGQTVSQLNLQRLHNKQRSINSARVSLVLRVN